MNLTGSLIPGDLRSKVKIWRFNFFVQCKGEGQWWEGFLPAPAAQCCPGHVRLSDLQVTLGQPHRLPENTWSQRSKQWVKGQHNGSKVKPMRSEMKQMISGSPYAVHYGRSRKIETCVILSFLKWDVFMLK